MTDSRIREIVEKQCTKEEIEEFYRVFAEETKVHINFIAQAKRLKEYYQQKANSTLSKNRG